MSTIFDSHCHPQFAAYDNDRDEVLRRAFDQGVAMIAVGTSAETSKAAAALAQKYSGKIWASVGIHPHHSTESPLDTKESAAGIGSERLTDFPELRELALRPEVVAIGEAGLDYHYLPAGQEAESAKASQRQSFLEHIKLAKEAKKPLIVHGRDAYGDILAILKNEALEVGMVMHFFQGKIPDAKAFLDLGCYISFAGPITFPPKAPRPLAGRDQSGVDAGPYREVVEYVPLDRILAETDAPYASPLPHRGKRNEPPYVKFVIQKIAEIKGITFEAASARITQNAQTLFGIH